MDEIDPVALDLEQYCFDNGLIASMLCEAESSHQAWPPLKQQQQQLNTITTSWDSAINQSSFLNQNLVLETNTRGQVPANSHILAERKRREKLTQKFIALSALIPGLKKIDKASILGDAIKYMQQLQERLKILEDKQAKKKSMEESSAVFVRKYVGYFSDKENEYSSETTEQLPKIEARFCDKDVLIVIHCLKTKGIVAKTVVEIEKLHLSVVNTCAMSFGDSTLNLTISAQKDEDFSMSMEDLMRNLRVALAI